MWHAVRLIARRYVMERLRDVVRSGFAEVARGLANPPPMPKPRMDVEANLNFARAKSAARSGAAAGLAKAVIYLRGEANQTVPIEEGTLQRSGGVDVDAGTLEASAYYDTPYAAAVHEDTTARHDPGRRAKWLESTVHDNRGQVLEIIAGEMRKAFRG